MLDRSLSQLAPDRFRIDFARLRGEQGGALGWLRWFADRSPVALDPSLVGRALRAVMRRCATRSAVDERLILWNEYWIVLAPEDHEQLQPLLPRLNAELDTVIRRTIEELDADTEADPVVRIVTDDEHRTARGTAEIRAAHNQRTRSAPSQGGEMTVRIADVRRTGGKNATESVREPATPGDLRFAWGDGEEAFLPRGEKVQLGRPHTGAPQRFVALVGSSRKINKCQVAVENAGERIIVTRLPHTNPVQVDGILIQPGGKMTIDRLPVSLSLSNGDLGLELARVGDR